MRYRHKQQLTLSLLDKLSSETIPEKQILNPAEQRPVGEIYSSVRRDLENLLNTRASNRHYSEKYSELNTSMLSYGLRDFMAENLSTYAQQAAFCTELQCTLQRFEPRFKKVQVHLLHNIDAQDRILRLRIEAILLAEPTAASIAFISVLKSGNNGFLVSDAIAY